MNRSPASTAGFVAGVPAAESAARAREVERRVASSSWALEKGFPKFQPPEGTRRSMRSLRPAWILGSVEATPARVRARMNIAVGSTQAVVPGVQGQPGIEASYR